MTRKARLQQWVSKLDPSIDPAMPAADLEQAIDSAIAKLPPDPLNADPDCPGMSRNGCPWLADEDEINIPSLGESLRIHWQITKSEAAPTVKAIASNLLN